LAIFFTRRNNVKDVHNNWYFKDSQNRLFRVEVQASQQCDPELYLILPDGADVPLTRAERGQEGLGFSTVVAQGLEEFISIPRGSELYDQLQKCLRDTPE